MAMIAERRIKKVVADYMQRKRSMQAVGGTPGQLGRRMFP
jgi:hypothetical protein